MTTRGYFVHESSYVDADVTIGEGTKIWHFSHVLSASHIGKRCNLGQNVMIGPNVRLGDDVKVQNNVSIYEGVELEDDVFCGPSMVFTNVINPRSHVPRKHEYRRTLVKRGATLGANCTVLCGVTIGMYAFVGAGAVVTKAVPDHALVMGNPARQRGWMCVCGEKIRFAGPAGACSVCASNYELREGACVLV
jgi:UDP-2-acetamido-3-amino-2,3-dideoxy-glucuronate N-acetyltransferase